MLLAPIATPVLQELLRPELDEVPATEMSKACNFTIAVMDYLSGKCILIGDKFVVDLMNVLSDLSFEDGNSI